ncbi:hypothetical protein Trydic_g15015 [Trypoxylus dichotomus]
MSGTLYPIVIGRGKLDPSRNRCDHSYEQTPGVPEPDIADGSLVRKEHTLHEDAGVEPLIDFIRKMATRFFDRAVDH